MTARFPVWDYDLAATLESGQVFRWEQRGTAWEGVVGPDWFRIEPAPGALVATAATADADWAGLRCFLGVDDVLEDIQRTFPNDPPMQAAIAACPGLRLLHQDPWECLASFVLSSTKQIAQIRQCVAMLCARFGRPVPVPPGHSPNHQFPEASVLARAGEGALRECRHGFRARYLAAVANRVAAGVLDLEAVRHLPTPEARQQLMSLPGVGRKIADCVLLFAYGRQEAFPVDVWVLRALRGLYFPKRRPQPRTLLRFTATHFGPHAGYAQQYLFHYARTCLGRGAFAGRPRRIRRPVSALSRSPASHETH